MPARNALRKARGAGATDQVDPRVEDAMKKAQAVTIALGVASLVITPIVGSLAFWGIKKLLKA